ncbi:MAG: extracellular solute-binding protein [Hyphomicrobiaceae bacterium]|nr:extracellular solute-binding protein [Hyphomicrobiaceae bacterium]
MPRPHSLLSGAIAPIVALAMLVPLAVSVRAGDDAAAVRHHALSLVDKPAAPPGFLHFDWVRPDAPKGGQIRLRALGTFDTLNPFVLKAQPAASLSLVNATLMTRSLDEPSTEYGLIAEWVSYPADHASATFGLRPEARFSDGKPITPDDVVFTLDALKKANPRYALYYKNVVKAEKVGPREVRFVFDGPGNRELPHIIGGLPVLPRHYWMTADAKGEPRDLSRGLMEVPVGAGPYRIATFEAGRRITYERIKDWWAKDLPVGRGQYNFDHISFIYYRDRLPAFEGFKAGETDFWPENSAKGWATEFDFDAVKRGHVKREEIPDGDIQSMQGFVFNLRRPPFKDRRVREAFNLAFNFEWANKAMFFEQYRRSSSYFGNSELACRGVPEGEELAILDKARSLLPAELFTTEYKNPVNAAPDDFRRNMGKAARLLAEAGYEIKDGIRTNSSGERLAAEVLLVQPSFERLVLAYKAELAKLGIAIDVRVVDSAQYGRRVQSFDFDIVVGSFPQSHSPGNEQREFWGTEAARQEGSRNIMGLESPVIDAIIERLIYADDRQSLVAATRALDRVLLWGHYLVPQFHSPVDRVAYWTKFARPERLPRHAAPSDAFIRLWWYDDAAAVRLAAERKG